ncbi:MAG: fumarylacetoacetate hydrolase family protein [Burkholderiales bacterium]|nr:MAG: fumarylacetoacetate hydrolase family protein [Burkholderiales bacterium]
MQNRSDTADPLPERLRTLAATLLDAYDRGIEIAPPSARGHALTLDEAYVLAAALIRIRQQRGERLLGRKIGFTNRTIWARYGVYAPIWGAIWDSTVQRLEVPRARASLAGLVQPRLEPEIVFGLAQAPRSSAIEDVGAAIGWVALGFEIVQSLYPDWRFEAADTVAAFGLHGRLYVGPPVDFGSWHDAARDLAALELALTCDGRTIDRGLGSNVLDGPVAALAHLVAELERRPGMPPLRAGDIVTTGTITDAAPLVPGQLWQSVPSGPPAIARLSGLTVQTTD